MRTKFLISGMAIFLLLFSFSLARKPSIKVAMKALEGFANYIPSGIIVVDGDSISVQAFYMSSTEISNIQYAEFLYDLNQRGEYEKLESAGYDSAQWNSLGWSMNAYSDYYHKHPAYHDYPVVNISKEGAELFCEWISAEYDSLSNGELKIKFRLPTRTEWLRAANSDLQYPIYSWEGQNLRSSKGLILANFNRIGAENIHFNAETNNYEIKNFPAGLAHTPLDEFDVTAPVKSYWPNGFGLYNMNGNVAEMVADENLAVGGSWHSCGYDIRNESTQLFTKAHPTVGFRVVATYIKPTT